MDYELRRAREKLNKEQNERKEIARKRLERERKAKDEARKQREALEVERSRRAFDAQQAQIKVRFSKPITFLIVFIPKF